MLEANPVAVELEEEEIRVKIRFSEDVWNIKSDLLLLQDAWDSYGETLPEVEAEMWIGPLPMGSLFFDGGRASAAIEDRSIVFRFFSPRYDSRAEMREAIIEFTKGLEEEYKYLQEEIKKVEKIKREILDWEITV